MKYRLLSGIVLFFVLTRFLWFWIERNSPSTPSLTPVSSAPAPRFQPPSPTPGWMLDPFLTELRETRNPAELQRTLERLEDFLASLPLEKAVRLVEEFLQTNNDHPTGGSFHFSSSGVLEAPSSLRVFLLDWLGRTAPDSGAAFSHRILETSENPDEWAISLRNLAWGAPEELEFIRTKTRELILNREWQLTHSNGYLESFDMVVYVEDTDFVPELARLLADPASPVPAQAAYLTLDRLVLNAPTATLRQLLSDQTTFVGKEQTFAELLARANLGDPEQRRLLEGFLLDESRSETAFEAFADRFPNANFSLSANLMTDAPVLEPHEIRERDASALSVVKEWRIDPRFGRHRERLERIQSRLEGFLRPKEQ